MHLSNKFHIRVETIYKSRKAKLSHEFLENYIGWEIISRYVNLKFLDLGGAQPSSKQIKLP